MFTAAWNETHNWNDKWHCCNGETNNGKERKIKLKTCPTFLLSLCKKIKYIKQVYQHIPITHQIYHSSKLHKFKNVCFYVEFFVAWGPGLAKQFQAQSEKKKKGKVKRISHATMYFSLFFIDYLQTCTGNL